MFDSAVALNAGGDGGAELAGMDGQGVATVGGKPDAGGAARLIADGKPDGAGEDGAGAGEVRPEPELVELTIESAPEGAEVRLSGSRKVLGTTPYVHKAERGGKRLTFTLTLSGYSRERVSLSANEDGSKRVELKKRATSSGAKKPKKPPDTKDPFGGGY
jgi:hypothetical protein